MEMAGIDEMTPLRQTWSILAAVCLAAALAVAVPQMGGCAAGTNPLGSVLLAPDTFAKKLAVEYVTVTEIRSTATALLNAGKISGNDGQNTLDATDVARAGLDVARDMAATDLSSAEAKLTAAKTILDSIRAYLLTKGGA
jgi:hypothetical protein